MNRYEPDEIDALGWLVVVVAALCVGAVVWVGFLLLNIWM